MGGCQVVRSTARREVGLGPSPERLPAQPSDAFIRSVKLPERMMRKRCVHSFLNASDEMNEEVRGCGRLRLMSKCVVEVLRRNGSEYRPSHMQDLVCVEVQIHFLFQAWSSTLPSFVSFHLSRHHILDLLTLFSRHFFPPHHRQVGQLTPEREREQFSTRRPALKISRLTATFNRGTFAGLSDAHCVDTYSRQGDWCPSKCSVGRTLRVYEASVVCLTSAFYVQRPVLLRAARSALSPLSLSRKLCRVIALPHASAKLTHNGCSCRHRPFVAAPGQQHRAAFLPTTTVLLT